MAKVSKKKRNAASGKSSGATGRAAGTASLKKAAKTTSRKTVAGSAKKKVAATGKKRKIKKTAGGDRPVHEDEISAGRNEPTVTSQRGGSEPATVVSGDAAGGAEVPQFNLAEQMLADKRRTTSHLRKGPAGKTASPVSKPPEPKRQSSDVGTHRIERAIPESSEKQQIIAEIVARDIERLRKGP